MNALTQLTAFLVVLALSASSVVQSPAAKGQNFELLILHNNDMHARFEQTSQLSGTCTTADRDAGKCYGGFPRVAYVVKEARKAAASGEGPPVLYLNAGDTYTGTAWFTIYKWKIAAEFINALQPDAVSLGNHEFDDGVAGLTPFIRNLTAPVVAANLLLDNAPELETEPNLHKSIIILIENTKIGIIGYLTPTTKFLAKKNEVEYEDEIIAIKREVETLKNEGVNIFIALGHSGYIRDIEIAKNVDDIDLVIGGHSHTYLGKPIDGETDVPQGPYPTMVSQPSGRRVPVVQAYAFTKYLGKLHMIFDSEGEIIECDGIPLLLDHEIPNDPELQNVIVQYENEMKKINDEILGQSLVPLDGNCRLAECNMGNLITDAVLEYTALYHPELSDLNIALLHSGTIRTSIDHHEKPVPITRGELFMVLPFADELTVVTMNGTMLKRTLEHSVAKWRKVDSSGQFLQMSGMKVTYDLSLPVGSRVVRAQTECPNCSGTKLADIREQNEYKIIMPAFMANGGDAYTFFEGLPQNILPYDELKCTIDYIGRHNPVNPQTTDRITVLNEERIKMEARINKAVGLSINLSLYVITLTISSIYIIATTN